MLEKDKPELYPPYIAYCERARRSRKTRYARGCARRCGGQQAIRETLDVDMGNRYIPISS
jgi:hypothetical protein